MTQVLEKVRDAASSASNAMLQLQSAAAERAEQMSRSRYKTMKRDRYQAVQELRKRNKRIRRAVQGLEALDVLAQSKEVQKLLRLSGKISLWHGYLYLPSHPDGEGGHYSSTTYEFYMILTAEGIQLRDSTRHDGKEDLSDSTSLFFPYCGSSFIRYSRLEPIATSVGCNPAHETDTFESVNGQGAEAPMSILFQILADCANPRMLSKYFMKAIGGW